LGVLVENGRRSGPEARKSLTAKLQSGFIEAYLSGEHILDIGYRGYEGEALPIVPNAVGIDLDYPGYDGRTLPFPDGSQDAVYSSHCLEHIGHATQAIADWFRVVRYGGHLVIVVPHQFLYERRTGMPSRWSEEHRRFYTPASLLQQVERALQPNSYRIRRLIDHDAGFDYAIPPQRHPDGCYEIELVIEKIVPPRWQLERPPLLALPLHYLRRGAKAVLPQPIVAWVRKQKHRGR
jgi:SAM-dependent methyltransferase